MLTKRHTIQLRCSMQTPKKIKPSRPDKSYLRNAILSYAFFLFSLRVFHHAVIWLRTVMLIIITSKPIVTTMSNANENQPITMALVPTPLLTAPLPKSWAMTDAATEAVCCHKTETRTKMEAMKMIAKATWETGREGNGLTFRSEPSESSSSCHPGHVARRMKQTKAKMMAMMLNTLLVTRIQVTRMKGANSHQVGKHNHVLELRR